MGSGYEYASFCSIVYDNGSFMNSLIYAECMRNGWIRLKTSKELGVTGYGYFGMAFYRKNELGMELMIAHRGTRFNETGNILANIEISEDERPKILDEALLYVEMIMEMEMEIVKITHTGHSLGGFIAGACAGLSTGAYAVTFECPGIGILDIRRDMVGDRIINYVTNRVLLIREGSMLVR